MGHAWLRISLTPICIKSLCSASFMGIHTQGTFLLWPTGGSASMTSALSDASIEPRGGLDSAIDHGILGGEMDRGAFRRGLADIVADYSALPLKDWSLADAFLRVTRLGQGQNVFIPYDLTVLTRALFLSECVVRILDPDFLLLDNLLAKGPEILNAAMG
jgi:hypothetical protein